jgi:predicted RNA-binding protein with PIN domain
MGTMGTRIILVDGYNVINRVPELRPSLEGGLQNARNRLVLQVSTWSHGHPGVECVIVFDGDFEHSGGRGERIAGVRCIYSLTAHGGDDEIIRFVRDYKGRKSDMTVVSDDNKVGNNCRAHGAAVRPSSYIMNVGGKGSGGPSARGRAEKGGRPRSAADGGGRGDGGGLGGKGIDRKTAAEIDRELRKKFKLDKE